MDMSLLRLHDTLGYIRTELKDAIIEVENFEEFLDGVGSDTWTETRILIRRLKGLYRITETIVPKRLQDAINHACDEAQYYEDMDESRQP